MAIQIICRLMTFKCEYFNAIVTPTMSNTTIQLFVRYSYHISRFSFIAAFIRQIISYNVLTLTPISHYSVSKHFYRLSH